MRYVLLIHESADLKQVRSDPSIQAAGAAYGEQLHAAGIVVTAAGLHPPESAKLVSVRDSALQVVDGPFAETKEAIGGFVVIDVPNLEDALEWAGKHPAAKYATIEVRQVFAGS